MTATVLRFPCGCPVDSYRQSCAHVCAEAEILRGMAIAARQPPWAGGDIPRRRRRRRPTDDFPTGGTPIAMAACA